MMDGVARISQDSVRAAVKDLANGQAIDGVFVSCGSLRIVDIVESLEADIGKPVFSSNTALAWHALRLGGYKEPISGFGRLLRS